MRLILNLSTGFTAGYNEAFDIAFQVKVPSPPSISNSRKKRRMVEDSGDDGRSHFESELREIRAQVQHIYTFVKSLEAKQNSGPALSYHPGVVIKYLESVNQEGNVVSFIPCDSAESIQSLNSLLNFNELMISLVSFLCNSFIKIFKTVLIFTKYGLIPDF